MAKDVIVWCLEAPDGCFLKEVITHQNGFRLVFTTHWFDDVLKFNSEKDAIQWKEDNGFNWLSVTDHEIIN